MQNVKPEKLSSRERAIKQLLDIIDGATAKDKAKFIAWVGAFTLVTFLACLHMARSHSSAKLESLERGEAYVEKPGLHAVWSLLAAFRALSFVMHGFKFTL